MANNAILSELTYQANEGALHFKGVRYLLIRPETLASIQAALETEIGIERAGEILYAGGFTGGRLSGRKYKESFGLSDREAVEFMCRMGGEIGWGHFRLVELDAQAQRLVVEVESSPFAEAYHLSSTVGQRSPAGICHLIRGVLGGLGEGIFGVPVHARETQCLANRSPYCQFEIIAW
jgi:predicted hydrocarbon binding protein